MKNKIVGATFMTPINKGFTLLELLVVIMIIGVLAAMILPATQKAVQKAKENRTKAEMQLLATTIMQVYSEVGYYVKLEDLVKSDETKVEAWLFSDYSTDKKDDNEIIAPANTLPAAAQTLWAGPYTTYKNYKSLTADDDRPADPWKHQYRMFWINTICGEVKIPAGANGTMVIISAGSDGKLDSCGNIIPDGTDIASFTPDDDDIYYNFNAGIQ